MGLDMYLIKRKKEEKNIDLWNFDNELIYWRKANMVHRFMCDNGEEIENEVAYKISKNVLEELLNRCNKILKIVKTKKGMIKNGATYMNGVWEPILEEGLEIINQDEIKNILPTCDGCFYGSTDYDEYYLEDIKYTKEQLENIIETIDYDNEDVYYLASW